MATTQNIKKRIMLNSRSSKLAHFYSLFEPGMSVLDVGVTSKDDPGGDGPQNYLLKTWRYAPETYTGLGVQDVSGLEREHPRMKFVQYDGRIFPFRDNQFDWVFSNAVIEHVGDRDAQLLFLNEMLRVARYVFFTTPSKHFPIETHTGVPLIHWNERLFDTWLSAYRPARRSNLRLLSSGDVRRLLADSIAVDFSIHRNRLLLWPMTLTVVASRLGHVPVPRRVTHRTTRAARVVSQQS